MWYLLIFSVSVLFTVMVLKSKPIDMEQDEFTYLDEVKEEWKEGVHLFSDEELEDDARFAELPFGIMPYIYHSSLFEWLD